MNTKLAICLLSAFATTSFADPIQLTVQCSGSPLRETTRSTIAPATIKLTADDAIEPIKMTTPDGQKCVIQLIGDFSYPTVLAFPKVLDAPIEQKNREIRNTGLEVEITPTREGNQIVFHGRCLITRLASTSRTENIAPENRPSVASATFIARECTFAGRAPVGTAAKINLGEQGIDACELTLTFANAK